MSVKKRDSYTGHLITGHDWNGITELNTKVPFILLLVLAGTILFSIAYWVLMPAWPTGRDYTRGSLGIDQHRTLELHLLEAEEQQKGWKNKLTSIPVEEISANEELMAIVSTSGPALFLDNCAVCHGEQGEGMLYFPNLTDTSVLWGMDVTNVLKTLKAGINAGVEGTRIGMMPAFGELGTLNAEQIEHTSLYVRSLSNPLIGNGAIVKQLLAVENGQALYEKNCTACHGTKGLGNSALGAPNLTDSYWIYGGDQDSVEHTLQQGRSGHMPAWQERLTEAELRILSVYVSGLASSGSPDAN